MTGKDAARTAVRGVRRTRTEQRRREDAGALAAAALAHPAVAGAGVVAAYVSTPAEPGTAALRTALAARGTRVLLPVVAGAGPLAWVVDGEDGPARADLLAGAGVVLLPALAVTADGHRLGQGGGHYDRTLAAPARRGGGPGAPAGRRPLLVAVVHGDEVLPAGSWPVEEHDVGVDAVLTPAGWTDVLPGRAPGAGPGPAGAQRSGPREALRP